MRNPVRSSVPGHSPIAPRLRPGRARRRRLFAHELNRLVRVAGPIVASQLGMIGMSTVDTLMVGPLGAAPLAAVAIASAVHVFVLILCTGTLVGMSPLVSQAFGAGDPDQCRRILVQGLWLALFLSIPVAAFSLIGQPLALLLRQDPEVAAIAGGYMQALAVGVLPMLLFTAFRQYLEGMGIVRPAMLITFLGLGLNVVANATLIYGIDGWVPALGAVGSGWATSIVRGAMLLSMLFYVRRHHRVRSFGNAVSGIDRPIFRRILVVGTPVGIQYGLEVGLFSAAAVMMGWFGPAALAAHQITINIAATTFMVGMGVSVAGAIRVGQHIGAGNRRAVRRATDGTYLLAIGFMALCALVFIAAPRSLVGLYTSDPAILEIASTLLLTAAAFQIFDGAQVAGISVLRGAADTRFPTVIAAFGYWIVGFPAAYILGFLTPLGPTGVWLGLTLALAIVAALLLVRVRGNPWLHHGG